MTLSDTSRDLAGILLLTIVTIEFGGAFMLRVVQGKEPTTDLQKSFFRAGHAHAGVLVMLSLIIQVYVDATDMADGPTWLARSGVPIAALLIPGGFFFSVMKRGAEKPNRFFWMIPAGAVMLALGVVATGVGLLTA
jgi:drug/metabolite transporter superfamily protein YnfA